MTALVTIALSNVAVASLLALIAYAAGKTFRRPALTHGLWALVLVKLVTPPMATVSLGWLLPPEAEAWPVAALKPDPPEPLHEEAPQAADLLRAAPAPVVVWPDFPEGAAQADPDLRLQDAGLALPKVAPLIALANHTEEADSATTVAAWSLDWLPLAVGLWMTGAVLWFSVAGLRLSRFQRLLRHAKAAPGEVQARTQSLAQRLGVRCPRVLLVPGVLSPMLWFFAAKPRLLLPVDLLARLDKEQQAALIAHELAHWRRRDHLVRWLEIIVLGLYWWCPLVWWARSELQQAEEECCDAWVVWALPGAAKAYALALVETVDFLCGAMPALPPAASGIGHVHFLKRRLTMIMRGTTPRALTAAGVLVVLGLAALMLPLVPSWAQAPAQDPVPAAQAQPIDPDSAIRNAQVDIERIQANLQRLQAELQQKQRQLQEAMFQGLPSRSSDAKLQQKQRQLQEAIERLKKGDGQQGNKQPPKGFGPPPIGGGKGPKGSDTGKGPPAGKTPFGGMGGKGGDMMGGGKGPGSDRLQEVEKKLDLLLWEIQNLRRELHGQRGGGMPGGGGQGGQGGRPGGQPGGGGGQGGFPGGGQPGGGQGLPGGGFQGGKPGGGGGFPGGGGPGGGFPGGGPGGGQPGGPGGVQPPGATPSPQGGGNPFGPGLIPADPNRGNPAPRSTTPVPVPDDPQTTPAPNPAR